MANIKGTGFLGFQSLLLKKFGAAAEEKVKAQLSEEDRTLLFGKKILPIGWVDYGAYTRYMIAADRLFGKGDKELIVTMNREIANTDTRGLYRIFFMVLTTKAIFTKAGQLWRLYYDKGSLTVTSEKSNQCEFNIVGIPDIPHHHEYANYGYFGELGRLTGAKNIKIMHPKCQARGDEVCRFNFYWDD